MVYCVKICPKYFTELDGKRFLMEHGDGVGDLPWTFRKLRGLFRCRFAQKLFAAIHPRWTVGFAHSWSSHSRKSGGYIPKEGVGESLVKFAAGYNAQAREKVDYFIFGHQHIILEKVLSDGSEVLILGDWITKFSYAVWDGISMKIDTFLIQK